MELALVLGGDGDLWRGEQTLLAREEKPGRARDPGTRGTHPSTLRVKDNGFAPDVRARWGSARRCGAQINAHDIVGCAVRDVRGSRATCEKGTGCPARPTRESNTR